MKPYSQDLREKVMAAVAAGKQPNWQIAETFGISESTIENGHGARARRAM